MPNAIPLAYFALFLAISIPISIIDAKTLRIPNRLLYPGLILMLVFNMTFLRNLAINAIIGSLTTVAFLYAIRFVTKGLGLGDVKYGALIGLYCGFPGLFSALILSSIFAFIIAVGLIATKKINRKTPIPFGPFLTIGAIASRASYPLWVRLLS